MIDLYFSVLPVMGACVAALWIISLLIRKVSYVDSFWGAGFVIVTWSAVLTGPGLPALSTGQQILVGLVTLWGARLALHLGLRFAREGEDRRYVRIMGDLTGARWALKALLLVFTMQGFLILMVSAPVLYVLSAPDAAGGPVLWIALAIWSVGFLMETVADAQLTAFKRNPDNHGKTLETGLWAWSRHPNYFGETLVWWAIWLASGNPLLLFSPAFVTFTLMKWSGIPLSEAGMKKTKEGYRDYQKNVSAFFPRPPRARSAQVLDTDQEA